MIRAVVAAMALLLAIPAAAQDAATASLQDQDRRLAQLADRIMAASAPLCSQQMPITGLTLHSADQYEASARPRLFPDGPLMVALVVPGSPAEAAGLRAGDVVRAIGSTEIADIPFPEEGHLREAAFDLLASQPRGQPFGLRVERDREDFNVAITAEAGCRALVEIVDTPGIMGRSDGRVIQLSFPLSNMLDDDGLAVIFTHELAHVVLHHRARLEAAGVSKGLLGEFGRNRRLNRQVEEEADRMSAHLLARAGYDPRIAPAFWRSRTGRRVGGGLLRSRVYPSPEARAALIEAEIAAYLAQDEPPVWPAHLIGLRDQPFTP
jgi:Zn-dependent protease with chaperone function